jgi:hypothetical protein
MTESRIIVHREEISEPDSKSPLPPFQKGGFQGFPL